MLSGKVVGEPAPVIFKLRLRIDEDHRSKSSLAAAHWDHLVEEEMQWEVGWEVEGVQPFNDEPTAIPSY